MKIILKTSSLFIFCEIVKLDMNGGESKMDVALLLPKAD